MKKEYDFTNGIRNPYAKKLKTKITINVNNEVIDYFQKMSVETGIPYQNLINLFLVECVKTNKKIDLNWK